MNSNDMLKWPDIFNPSYYTINAEVSVVVIQVGILSFFVSLLTAIMSFRTALKKQQAMFFWIFSLAALFGLWNIFYIGSYAQRDLSLPTRTFNVEFLDRAHLIVGILLPLFTHKILRQFFHLEGIIRRLTPLTLLAILALAFLPFDRYYKLVSGACGFLIFFLFSLIILQVRRLYLTTHDPRIKIRGLFVFAGMLLSLVLTAAGQIRAENLLPGVPLPFIGNIFTACFIYFLYQMILNPRLREVRELMLRGLRLLVLTIILSIIFFSLIAWIGADNPELFIFNTFVASFIILSILEPLRRKMDLFFLKKFIVDRYEFEQFLDQLSTKLRGATNVDHLAQQMIQESLDSGRIYQTGLFLWDTTLREYRLMRPSNLDFKPSLSSEHPLVLYLRQNREPLVFEPEHVFPPLLQSSLEELHAHLVLPFILKEELLGFWALRASSQATNPFTSFSNSEIESLQKVCNEFVQALKQLKHFETQERQERLASLGEMSAALAHEIRNPLGAIHGATQLLETSSHLKNEEDRECLHILKKELLRMQRTVDQYLNFARKNQEIQQVHLNKMVQKIIVSLRPKSDKTGSQVHLNADPSLPELSLDPLKLEQVLTNLIQNACEAYSPNIWVTIQTLPTQKKIEITVRDDGPGIASSHLPNIFVPLFTTKKAGSGLGLPICKKIIDSLGGDITVKSELKKGTEFKITLPTEPVGPSTPPVDM